MKKQDRPREEAMMRNETYFKAKGGLSTMVLISALAAGAPMISHMGTAWAASSDYELTEIEHFLTGAARLDWSADGEWIAYDRKEPDGYFDVYRVRADGTGTEECLTCDHPDLPNRQQGNPALHPGGRWLLFQAEKLQHAPAQGVTSPGKGAYNDLWVMDLESAPPYDVYPLTDVEDGIPGGGSLHPHFSRDGTRVLWGDLQGAAGCFGDWRIAVAEFVTTPCPQPLEPVYYEPGIPKEWYETQDWALDDSGIYFSAAPLEDQDDRAQDFCYMDLASGELERLTETANKNGEDNEWDEHGKLTPRGDAIVWMTSQDYGTIPDDSCDHVGNLDTDLWIMNPDGSGKRKLTHYNDPGYPEYVGGGVCVSDHSWNHDGTKLAVEVYFRAVQRADMKIFHFAVSGPSPTPSPSPTPPSFTLRLTFQPYGAEAPPAFMWDWGQSYGEDEETGQIPGSGIELEYGWR